VAALQQAARQGGYPEYVGKILAAFPSGAAPELPQQGTFTAGAASSPTRLSEPLTGRELEVLRLAALTGKS
jgi:hypothetical protein